MKKMFMIFIIFVSTISAQSMLFEKAFGQFRDATSFDIDLNKNIYITDRTDNTIYKIDSLGNSITSIGGFGWNESLFDEPTNIFTNTLSVYVADKNNDRVQRFDKDLNFLSQYVGSSENSDGIEFGYPTCVAIANIGDLYILDSDNGRILKYDLSGEFILEIGGNDAGEFAISNPKNFTIDRNGNIYILDDTNINVFDQYGNGLLRFKTLIEANSISITNNKLLFVSETKLTILDVKNRKVILEIDKLSQLNENELIVDAKLRNNTLFFLTPKRILKYLILF